MATPIASIETVIEQQITLGYKSPDEVAEKILERYGEDWVRQNLDVLEILRAKATQALGQVRRSAQRRSDASQQISNEERLAPAWVPNRKSFRVAGWEAIGKLTRDEHLARAEHYRNLAGAHIAQAERHERFAALLREHGVATLNDLDPSLWGRAA